VNAGIDEERRLRRCPRMPDLTAPWQLFPGQVPRLVVLSINCRFQLYMPAW
jgi:hypothetical protein